MPLGIAPLDAALRGGLRRNALHEIRAASSLTGAGAGFALALAAFLARRDDRPVLWIGEAAARREAGEIYGPGLARFGLEPGRVIFVAVTRPAEALWVFEEGLRCRGLLAVVAEMRGNPSVLDLTASRRLALRARESGVMGLLLRQAGEPDPGAALTRWLAMPRPAAVVDDYAAGIGRPAWRLALERNRNGATGTFDLEWDHVRSVFAAVPTAPGPVAAPAGDRPPAARSAGRLVALRDAS